MHPAIVTHDEFYQANEVVRRLKKAEYRITNVYPLKGKARCGNCKRVLSYVENGPEPTLFCRKSRLTGKHSGCCKASYSLRRINTLTSKGLFSRVDLGFAPRDTSATCDTLDLTLNCVFDKPYDFYVEANVVGATFVE